MIDNYLYTTFPFYDSIDKQNFKKEWMHNDLCSVPLLAPQNRLLPFQITRRTYYQTLTHLYLYDWEGNFVKDILGDIPTGQLKITTAGIIDHIYYYATKDLTDFPDCGYYYLHATDGLNNWYSEVFCVSCCEWGVTSKIRVVKDSTALPNPPVIIKKQDILDNYIITSNKN